MRRLRTRLSRLRLPPPTLRLRLTALYGALFLITGAVFLTLGYLLVRHNLNQAPDVRAALAKLGRPPPPHGVARFGSDTTDRRLVAAALAQLRGDALHRLLLEYVGALLLMTGVSVLAGWWLAGRALRPLRRIIATAQRVSGENLGERIGLNGPADELRELAETFDGMLERLDTAFASQRHFVANASHELRTPLAIMRAELDVALVDPEAGERELRGMAEELRETVDRCERLIEGLLMLARSEAATGHEEPVDLASLAGDCITDLSARSRDGGLHFRDYLAPTWARGDPALLERMVANLIDNAIRYNQPGGFVEVRTWSVGDRAHLEVRNTGAAISPADAERLIEPFQRLNRTPGGFGLGLSIVSSTVRAHRGATKVTPRDGGGLVVAVELPASGAGRTLMVSEEAQALTPS
ncbi:MAG TPA: HAMP domain-containing sensor histidine kinase [Solirubrobacteraceae bacterium]|nr:HAMP domain-containing sensor histidine kinase [Solirubrobacteraceae bacterium]